PDAAASASSVSTGAGPPRPVPPGASPVASVAVPAGGSSPAALPSPPSPHAATSSRSAPARSAGRRRRGRSVPRPSWQAGGRRCRHRCATGAGPTAPGARSVRAGRAVEAEALGDLGRQVVALVVRREPAGPHVLGEGPQGGDRHLADLGVAADELRPDPVL